MNDELEMYKEKYNELMKSYVKLQNECADLHTRNAELIKENSLIKIDLMKITFELKRVYDVISETSKSA